MIAETQNNTQKPQVPFMKTLMECINKMVKDGYTDNLKMTKQGLYSPQKDRTYTPEEVTIINFYRFEGQSDPADNAILYVIETTDGVKGTLVDAYGAYADEAISKFTKQVEEINKKVQQSDKNG
jgi:hypothetical protein